MSLGVVRYCTPEGGSGYVANPALPWLSSFVITQEAPVYDQGPGWLRDTRPGTYTYYPRFGPPYSRDGGVLPPYWDVEPQPAPAMMGGGCSGLGAVPADLFEARYGRPEPDAVTCLQIQCGAIPQEQAGMELVQDCANAGYAGARSCDDPACSPWKDRIPGCSAGAAPVLLRADVVAPMPSITSAARRGCATRVSMCPSGLVSWVDANPLLALGLAFGVGALLFGGKR